MQSYFKSEVLKIRHTFIEKLVFIAPIFAILLAFVLQPMYFQVNCYNWWYSMLLPGMISLGGTLTAVKDKKMKNRAVLSLPIDLKKVWISKILVCVAIIIFASIIHLVGTIIIGSIFNINPQGRITVFSALLATLVLIITFLWQVPFCLFLGSKIGMFGTILINLAAYTVLGVIVSVEKVLWIIPYAITPRLMCPILKVLPNGLPAVPGNETFRPELLSSNVILPGITITVILFIVLTYVTAKWYEKQEAK